MVLSCERMPTGIDPFFSYLRFYFPPPKRVLDVSFGIGSSWTGADIESTKLAPFMQQPNLDANYSYPKDWFDDYEVIATDGTRQRGITIASVWDSIPLKPNSIDVGYWDPPFMFAEQSYTLSRQVKGKYSEIHVSHGWHELKAPAVEFARVCGIGFIIKIQDTRFEGQFVPQHVHLINQMESSGYWKLFDIIVAYYYRKKQAGSPGYALPVHDYYLIFKRLPGNKAEWDNREKVELVAKK